MIYSALTKKALTICFEAHKEQKDKAGLPYVFHPYHLAEQMNTEEEVCVALLHDVLEDTSTTAADLREKGIPETVLTALQLLKHDKGTPYFDYVAALKANPLARKVKKADLEHNSDLTRLNHPAEKDIERAKNIAKRYDFSPNSPRNAVKATSLPLFTLRFLPVQGILG